MRTKATIARIASVSPALAQEFVVMLTEKSPITAESFDMALWRLWTENIDHLFKLDPALAVWLHKAIANDIIRLALRRYSG